MYRQLGLMIAHLYNRITYSNEFLSFKWTTYKFK